MSHLAIKQHLFSNIPKTDYIESSVTLQNVILFLGFQKKDVSNATGQPQSSIRYDERIPYELKIRIQEIGNIINLVAEHFEGSLDKTRLWFDSENPMLGNISPRNMIRYGQYKKLYKFVITALAGDVA